MLAPHHARAHVVHGALLLGAVPGSPSALGPAALSVAPGVAHPHERALQCFRCAYALDKRDLGVFQGLVDAHLVASRFKDALFAAKEALQRAPRNPKALTLVGAVLGHSVEGREKARAAFVKVLGACARKRVVVKSGRFYFLSFFLALTRRRWTLVLNRHVCHGTAVPPRCIRTRFCSLQALSIDPNCLDAVFALTKLETTEKKYEAAVALLSRHVAQHNRDSIHTKLANIYVLMGDSASASQHFQVRYFSVHSADEYTHCSHMHAS